MQHSEQPYFPLFSPISPETAADLTDFAQVLAAVRPMSGQHWKTLPADIVQLSRLLTQERAGIRDPYWRHPALVSAYLYYFLPWNIVRMVRFLRDLPLRTPKAHSLFVDIGAGPATVPIALWFAKPAWRSIPLTLLLHDTSAQAVHLGRALLEQLPSAWSIVTRAIPLWKLPQDVRALAKERDLSLAGVSFANVVNEYVTARRTRERDTSETTEDMREQVLTARLAQWVDHLVSLLPRAHEATQGPFFLSLEPGTRLGGKICMLLRAEFLRRGFRVVTPCPHNGPCPLLARARRTWCHFTCSSDGAPDWLLALSDAARVTKQSLSLAPLLVTTDTSAQTTQARVVSSPFAVPRHHGMASYACHESGLLLLETREALPSGAGLAEVAISRERDPKSGARRARPV